MTEEEKAALETQRAAKEAADLAAKELEGKDPTITDDPSAGTQKTDEQKIPYDRFKAKVDEVNDLKTRLEAFEKAQEEARKKELSDVELAKEEAADLKAKLDAVQADALVAKKESLLAKAGYSDEQIVRYTRYIVGGTDEELATSLEALVADIAPKKAYVDPSSKGNGARQTPAKKDLHDKGTSAYQRLKTLGRIK